MFSPYLVDWKNINFSASLDACKTLHVGNSMKSLRLGSMVGTPVAVARLCNLSLVFSVVMEPRTICTTI